MLIYQQNFQSWPISYCLFVSQTWPLVKDWFVTKILGPCTLLLLAAPYKAAPQVPQGVVIGEKRRLASSTSRPLPVRTNDNLEPTVSRLSRKPCEKSISSELRGENGCHGGTPTVAALDSYRGAGGHPWPSHMDSSTPEPETQFRKKVITTPTWVWTDSRRKKKDLVMQCRQSYVTPPCWPSSS